MTGLRKTVFKERFKGFFAGTDAKRTLIDHFDAEFAEDCTELMVGYITDCRSV